MTSRRNILSLGSALSLGMLVPTVYAAEKAKSTERAMNRKDVELTKEECLYVLEHEHHAVLSTSDSTNEPYGVPVSPMLIDGALYFHTGKITSSRKQANMRMNPKVSLCYVAQSDINRQYFSVNCVSVIVSGTAREVTDPAEIKKIMYKLSEYHVNRSKDAIDEHWRIYGMAVAIWKIDIKKISGKGHNKELYFGSRGA